MIINKELILYLEELSKLSFQEDEKERILADLNTILTYFSKISILEISEKDIEDDFENINNFRKDKIEPSFERELILKNAPSLNDKKTMFSVPKTL